MITSAVFLALAWLAAFTLDAFSTMLLCMPAILYFFASFMCAAYFLTGYSCKSVQSGSLRVDCKTQGNDAGIAPGVYSIQAG